MLAITFFKLLIIEGIMKPHPNEEFNGTSDVEIKEIDGAYGVYSLKNVKKGDLVLFEPVTCAYVLRPKDLIGSQSDACAFVEAIYRSPHTLGRYFNSFRLTPIDGVFEKPPSHDRKFLKKVSKKFKKTYEEVVNIWRIVCTYHVRNYLLPSYKNDLKVRLQMSPFFNRINHHCSPNSHGVCHFSNYEDFEASVALVLAIQDISPGDEITYSYIDSRVLRADKLTRREVLSDCYDFTCLCSRCLSES